MRIRRVMPSANIISAQTTSKKIAYNDNRFSKLKPSMLGFSDSEFKWIVVEESKEGVLTYTGVLKSGGEVQLSPGSGQKELLKRGEYTGESGRVAAMVQSVSSYERERHRVLRSKLILIVVCVVMVCAAALDAGYRVWIAVAASGGNIFSVTIVFVLCVAFAGMCLAMLSSIIRRYVASTLEQ